MSERGCRDWEHVQLLLLPRRRRLAAKLYGPIVLCTLLGLTSVAARTARAGFGRHLVWVLLAVAVLLALMAVALVAVGVIMVRKRRPPDALWASGFKSRNVIVDEIPGSKRSVFRDAGVVVAMEDSLRFVQTLYQGTRSIAAKSVVTISEQPILRGSLVTVTLADGEPLEFITTNCGIVAALERSRRLLDPPGDPL